MDIFTAVILTELSLFLQWNQEVSVPMSKKKPILSSSNSSTLQKAAKDGSRKDNYATPMNKKPLLDSSEKKTPRSLRMSVSFTPIREINKLTSSVIRKIENSRLGANPFKESKDCFTPLKTPTMVSFCFSQTFPIIYFHVQFLSTLLR